MESGRDANTEPAARHVVGRFVESARGASVLPIDTSVEREIVVTHDETHGAIDGDVVSVQILRPAIASRFALGRVVEVLGSESDAGIDVEIITRKYGIPVEFPASVLDEADAIADSVMDHDRHSRRDLRSWSTVTIDGETARDFDDAISAIRLSPDRWSLGVHVADVSHYVRSGSALDDEALRRGTSVYFPDRAIPMLPERLSNGICSLNPHVDRLTFSVVMTVDDRGNVLDRWIGRSVIRSRARLTYTEVHALLATGSSSERLAPFDEMLREMEALARVLIARRDDDGAIDFDLAEPLVVTGGDGRTVDVVRAERTIAHRLVEQFMILANVTVARFLAEHGVPFLYRVHEPPDDGKVSAFAAVARSFGHAFAPPGPARPVDYQRLARSIAGRPEQRMLSYAMLRSLKQARYTPVNHGHFGLATDCYTHFTSPIRRYPDLLVHRILGDTLDGARHRGPRLAELEWIGDLASERERVAQDAERDVVAWRRAALMSERLGDETEGVVTDVREVGLLVELREVFVEGFVHESTLVDDEYVFRERTRSLVGRRSKRAFRIGDSVIVRIDRVDRTRQFVDLSIVGAVR